MIEILDQSIKDNGPEAVLPQNLSDELLRQISMEASYLMEVGDEVSETEAPSCLMLCILTILFYQTGQNSVEIAEEKLLNAIQSYAFALAAEEVTRKTDFGLEPPTLDNIFNDDRQIEVMHYLHV